MPGKKLLLEKGRSGKVGFNHRPTRGLREQSRRAPGACVPDRQQEQKCTVREAGAWWARVRANRRPAEREMERRTKVRQREYRAQWASLRALCFSNMESCFTGMTLLPC